MFSGLFTKSNNSAPQRDPFDALAETVDRFPKTQKISDVKKHLEIALKFRRQIIVDSMPIRKLIKLAMLDAAIDDFIKTIPYEQRDRDKQYTALSKEFDELESKLLNQMYLDNRSILFKLMKDWWLAEQLTDYLKQYNQDNSTQLVIHPLGYIEKTKTHVEQCLHSFLSWVSAMTASLEDDKSIPDIRKKHLYLSRIVYASHHGFISYFNRLNVEVSLPEKLKKEGHDNIIQLRRFFLADEALKYRYQIFSAYGQFRNQLQKRIGELSYPIGSAQEKARVWDSYDSYNYRLGGVEGRGAERCQSIDIPYLDRTQRYASLAQHIKDYFDSSVIPYHGKSFNRDSGIIFYEELLFDEMLSLQESFLAKKLSESEFNYFRGLLCPIINFLDEEANKLGTPIDLVFTDPGCELVHPRHKNHASYSLRETLTGDVFTFARDITIRLKLLNPDQDIKMCDASQLQKAMIEKGSQTPPAANAVTLDLTTRPVIESDEKKETNTPQFWNKNNNSKQAIEFGRPQPKPLGKNYKTFC